MSADSRTMVRALRRTGGALLVATLALTVLALSPAPAGAGEGMEVLCDKAGWACVAETGYHGQGVWGANNGRTGHNCTSYVSHRLSQRGVSQPWRPMGDAGRWDDNGRKHVRVDDVPAAGSVAQWEGGSRLSPGGSGHVAYVELVSADSIELTDDSYGGTTTRRFRIHRGSPYWPDHFVHIADLVIGTPLTDGAWTLAGPKGGAEDPIAEVTFGRPGDLPVAGDWDGDGDANVGTFHDGVWTLTSAHKGARMRPYSFRFGQALDLPVVGDWDGDGSDTVGVFRDGTWILAKDNVAAPETTTVVFGTAGDLPVVGDWDGDRTDTFGLFHDGAWTLTDSPFASAAKISSFAWGAAGDRPVAGDWDGIRGDNVGVFRSGSFSLSSDNSPTPRRTRVVPLGTAADAPVVGSWTRTANDTPGVVH